MKYLFLMVGVSGSGKSTFADKMVKGLHVVRHSSDDIRGELCGDASDQSKNGLVFKILSERVNQSLEVGSVIVDATNLKAKDRRQFYDAAKANNARVVAIVMTTPLEESIKHNFDRDRQVPKDVIERQFSMMSIPSLQEVDHVCYVNWSEDIVQQQIPKQLGFNYLSTKEFLHIYDLSQKN